MCLSFNIDFNSFFTKIDSISNYATTNSIWALHGVVRLEFEKKMFSKFLPWIFVVGLVFAVAFVLVFVFLTYLESWNRDWILVTLTSVFWPPLRLPGVLSVSRGTIQVQVQVSVFSTRPSLQSSLSKSRSSQLPWTKICASRWLGCPVIVPLMERWWSVGPGGIQLVGRMIASWQRSKLPLYLSLSK